MLRQLATRKSETAENDSAFGDCYIGFGEDQSLTLEDMVSPDST